MGSRYDDDMDSEEHVEKLIVDALASGELSPTQGVGKPIPNLDQDPMWWVKSLVRREKAADGLGEVIAERDRQLDLAVRAGNLSDARSIHHSLNRAIGEWNKEVEEEHRLDVLDEIWLLTERQNIRRGH